MGRGLESKVLLVKKVHYGHPDIGTSGHRTESGMEAAHCLKKDSKSRQPQPEILCHIGGLPPRKSSLQYKVNELQSLLRNQNVQTSQTIPFRRRFRLYDEKKSETIPDVM